MNLFSLRAFENFIFLSEDKPRTFCFSNERWFLFVWYSPLICFITNSESEIISNSFSFISSNARMIALYSASLFVFVPRKNAFLFRIFSSFTTTNAAAAFPGFPLLPPSV